MKMYVILKCEQLADQTETDASRSIWFVGKTEKECLNALDVYAQKNNIQDIYNWVNNDNLDNYILWELYECDKHLIKKLIANFEELQLTKISKIV